MLFSHDTKKNGSPLVCILRGVGVAPQTEQAAPDDVSARTTDDLGCYGWRNSPYDGADVLELIQKTGHVAALPYAWIEFAEFNPSEGITLHARGSKVTIRGRNLNKETRPQVRLFEGIVARRVAWVREAERSEDLAAVEAATVVAAITW